MAELDLLSSIRKNAAEKGKTIVLPESHDDRVLKAAEYLTKEKIAKVVTLGNPDKIQESAKRLNADLAGVSIIDFEKSEKLNEYGNIYYEMRKQRGKEIPMEKAVDTFKRDIFFGAMMVKQGEVDGSVSGSTATTADVMRASIQVVGMPKGISIVSSFFLMVFPQKVYSFADCAVNPNPDAKQLADIAISTAENHAKLTGEVANVAMLSFSTKGSAEHELIDKVREATKIANEKRPDLNIDGELQFDAAIIESIGAKKAPGSKVAGKANVLVFPDLQAGNIGYKIAERLGGAQAIGPISQGLTKPYFDLSRGCNFMDIVNTAAIAVLMS
ncbi:MAG: phosphate acetyltransferase [Ignavibacteriales bacterium]|nr:MAG: phosphate acetyltransferase [Ignavibacteriales bacterium]